jgi:hypothetical protein
LSLVERIRADLSGALKARETVRAGALRLLLSSIHNAEIEKKGALTDQETAIQVQKAIRVRREAIEGAEKGGRTDLVKKEQTELKVLESYLPSQLPAAELETLVTAAISEAGAKGPADMGKVMKILMPKVAGRADGAAVSQIVREKLKAPA